MSTEIFQEHKLSDIQIEDLLEKNEKAHMHWLIEEIIRPQLPSIRDNLALSLERLDESDATDYKLPLSSHNSESIKGTLIRKNFKIVGLNLWIKIKSLNAGRPINYKLKEGKEIMIRQLLDCHDSIENAISTLDKILENKQIESIVFLKYIDQIVKDIEAARKSLNIAQEAYVFPQLRISCDSFEPALPKLLALDIISSNSELRIDLFSLSAITQSPWNMILDQRQRISFADKVRSVISTDRKSSINKIIANEYTKLVEWKKSHELNDNSMTHNFMSLFGSGGNPSLSTLMKTANVYLEQCITCTDENKKPIVVKIEETKSVITNDPVLLSISIKLDSLDKAMNAIISNLK